MKPSRAFYLSGFSVVSVFLLFATIPAMAQTGTVTAESMPSDLNPVSGVQISVDIDFDLSDVDPPDDKLGSFTASLVWDPEVLCHVDHSGLLSGFTGVVNDAGADTGRIVFNGANPTGVGGVFTAITFTFDVCGSDSSGTDLDLEFSAMAAALTFQSLISILTVDDGHIHIAPSVQGVSALSIPSDDEPKYCDTIEVNIHIDVSGMDPPDDKLGSYTASLDWDPEVLCYVGNSGVLAGFTGVVNEADVAAGHLIFNGANAQGAGGATTVFQIYFHACGEESSSTDLDLGFSAMATAMTFRDLLPFLSVTDGHVHISSGKMLGDVDGNDRITPGDALCVFWRAIYNRWTEECDFPWADLVADINENGLFTPGDALCIFWKSIEGVWRDGCLPEPSEKSIAGENIYDFRIGTVKGKPLEVIHVPITVDSPQGFEAFGLQMTFPVNLLTFHGTSTTKATENWIALDGVEIEPGLLNIGGFHTEGLFGKGDIPILVAIFSVKEKVQGEGELNVIHLMDNLAGAHVEKGHFAVKTIPTDFGLSQNYPNPFNPVTTIDYTLAEDSRVELKMYNLLGQVIAVLVDSDQKAGYYQVQWDGSDMTSGVYFYRITAGEFTATKRMVLMK